MRYAVLDEADRMLDEGFEPAIRKLMSYCSESNATPGTVLIALSYIYHVT